MSITKYVKQFFLISITRTFYYNFLCPKVDRRKGFIIIYKGVSLQLGRKSRIIVEHGTSLVGFGQTIYSKIPSIIRLSEGSTLKFNGRVIIEYGADILLKKNALLEVGNKSYINCRCLIRCHKRISLGNEVLISNGLNLRDSDGHAIDGIIGEKPVNISDHVWIGTNVTILKGVHISSGAMIGANSLVTHDIENDCIAFGVPAKVHKRHIKWDY